MAEQPSPFDVESYWSKPAGAVLAELKSSPAGLSGGEAARRLTLAGPNTLAATHRAGLLIVFLRQFNSAIIIILLVAAAISAFLQDWVDALIIGAIIVGSAILSTVEEYDANNAADKLRERLSIRSQVLRDGATVSLPAAEVVPGDLVLLSAGSLVPADGLLLEANDFFVSEFTLTGETFPVEKKPGVAPATAGLAGRSNCVFMGTNVRSGSATALIVETGPRTVYGEAAGRLNLRPPETEFERGIRRLGYLLGEATLVLVFAVFAINVFFHKPVLDSLLFSLALAVGLTPQLLPAIININLSRGSLAMARAGVIVRQLSAIENFGSMDVLCTDKTGTITAGVVKLDYAAGADGSDSERVLSLAYLNARFQSGLANPLDDAILAAVSENHSGDVAGIQKLAEIPYDFHRKRLSVILSVPSPAATLSDSSPAAAGAQTGNRADVMLNGSSSEPSLQQDSSEASPLTQSASASSEPLGSLMLTKGALEGILDVCTQVEVAGGAVPLDATRRAAVEQLYADWSGQGYRVLGVAYKSLPADGQPVRYSRDDERDLTYAGALLFFDPPKPDVPRVLADLAALGVQLKIITGDNRLVARHAVAQVGLPEMDVLTGDELSALSDEALMQRVERANVFAEVDPNEKERIILALKKRGHVVGYMGDGINDTPALHAADVGISVDTAVDVAKQAAQFVLLRQDLAVLHQGIVEGRRTFGNTLKYAFMATSANFGNMFSVAGASLFLPFLPMLPKQILLINFMTDLPEMTIAGDNVDPEWTERPHRWDIAFIRRFMLIFGPLSSVFDFLTFGFFYLVLRASPELFHTGWFVESILSATAVVFAVRTRLPFWRSRPSRAMLLVTAAVAVATVLLPYTPLAQPLGFVPLPAGSLLAIFAIVVVYFLSAEGAKTLFYRAEARRHG